MIINSLAVQHIRTHAQFTCSFSPKVTVITGKNGSGKTSLIEAIYVALQGTSFRGSDKEILENGQPWWRIDIRGGQDEMRTIKFDPSRQTGRKQFTVDDKTTYRLPPAQKYPVVLFEPDDLRLISGSPSRRRQFIDRFISQLDPQYQQALRKYERALKQRNTLLKRQLVETDDLFVWNVALGEYGSYIITQRIKFAEQLNAQLNDAYNAIAHTDDMVSIHYSDTMIGNIKQKLMSELHARLDRDRLLGYTSVGPHRHDIVFNFNGTPALSAASRGEIRSIILALKFLEVTMIEQTTGNAPIILLDDVFGELDSDRQLHLAKSFADKQVIITSTSKLKHAGAAKTITLAE
jgi:DNA replication and repair protein RecF